MARQVVRDVDRGWKRIGEIVRTDDDDRVAVGVIGKNDGRGEGESNATIGSYHEYGAPQAGIPERSHIRATVDGNSAEYVRLTRRLGDLILTGALTTKQALGLLGLRVVADLKRRIQAGIPPPLKDRTIRRKHSSKQLVDSGQYLNSMAHEVRRA